MKYTVQRGVERQHFNRFKDMHFMLPLMIALAGLLAVALLPHGRLQNSLKPLTLGIYTVHTPDGGNNSSSNNKGKNDKSNTDSNKHVVNSAPSKLAPIASGGAGLGAASSGLNTGGGGGTVGGLGGGTGGGLGGGTGVTPPPPPVTPPPPTVVCDNTGGISPITCNVCTPVISVVLPGQKVLLYNNGTCTLVN